MSTDLFTIVKRKSPRRRATGVHDPRPCPTCYAPMRQVDGKWACARHGEPTRP